jgi:hypothetical protein
MKSVDIIWSYGEWAVEGLHKIINKSGHQIPLIITMSTSFHHLKNNPHSNHSLINSPDVWYHFHSSEMKSSFLSQEGRIYSWLEEKSFNSANQKSKTGPISFLVKQPSASKVEAEMLLEMSTCLLKQLKTKISTQTNTALCLSRPNPVSNTELPDNPITVIGKEIFRNENMSQIFLAVNSPQLVVGSLTTTGKRLSQFSGPFSETLKRLLSIGELDRIYINIPWRYSIRSLSEPVSLPTELIDMMSNIAIVQSIGRLRVTRCKDWGPATKLLPLLLLSKEDLPMNSRIITFDDDRLYTRQLVKTLIDSSIKYPDAVITNAAWPIRILSSHGRRGIRNGPDFYSRIPSGSEGEQYRIAGPVDLVLGFFGVLYRK